MAIENLLEILLMQQKLKAKEKEEAAVTARMMYLHRSDQEFRAAQRELDRDIRREGQALSVLENQLTLNRSRIEGLDTAFEKLNYTYQEPGGKTEGSSDMYKDLQESNWKTGEYLQKQIDLTSGRIDARQKEYATLTGIMDVRMATDLRTGKMGDPTFLEYGSKEANDKKKQGDILAMTFVNSYNRNLLEGQNPIEIDDYWKMFPGSKEGQDRVESHAWSVPLYDLNQKQTFALGEEKARAAKIQTQTLAFSLEKAKEYEDIQDRTEYLAMLAKEYDLGVQMTEDAIATVEDESLTLAKLFSQSFKVNYFKDKKGNFVTKPEGRYKEFQTAGGAMTRIFTWEEFDTQDDTRELTNAMLENQQASYDYFTAGVASEEIEQSYFTMNDYIMQFQKITGDNKELALDGEDQLKVFRSALQIKHPALGREIAGAIEDIWNKEDYSGWISSLEKMIGDYYATGEEAANSGWSSFLTEYKLENSILSKTGIVSNPAIHVKLHAFIAARERLNNLQVRLKEVQALGMNLFIDPSSVVENNGMLNIASYLKEQRLIEQAALETLLQTQAKEEKQDPKYLQVVP